MVRWFQGLQFRLILGFTLALGLALAAVGVYTGYAANREVEQFSDRLGGGAGGAGGGDDFAGVHPESELERDSGNR